MKFKMWHSKTDKNIYQLKVKFFVNWQKTKEKTEL